MKRILKIYRGFLLILFIIFMIFSSVALYYFYNFIQPVSYTTKSLGEISEPGKLTIEVIAHPSNNMQIFGLNEPIGAALISPSGKEYTQSSRDVDVEIIGSKMTINILTADEGEWHIKYRSMFGVKVSLTRTFSKSNAAMLVSTKATKSSEDQNKYIVSMNISNKNYSYTIKAVRRSDGFSLTSSGDGGATLNIESYSYSGVWDFYLNTMRGDEEYSTTFSYTF